MSILTIMPLFKTLTPSIGEWLWSYGGGIALSRLTQRHLPQHSVSSEDLSLSEALTTCLRGSSGSAVVISSMSSTGQDLLQYRTGRKKSQNESSKEVMSSLEKSLQCGFLDTFSTICGTGTNMCKDTEYIQHEHNTSHLATISNHNNHLKLTFVYSKGNCSSEMCLH